MATANEVVDEVTKEVINNVVNEIVTPAHHYNKIILNLMIKNESKIIERCIGNALEHVDAISILDTGSTDNTVELCEKILSASGKPYKISVEAFKNFGYNRSVSFVKTQELCTELKWDAEKTYAMAVDGDMVIKPSASFKDFKLTENGYNVIQANGMMKYYNSRFMKCAYPWKCVGATHEYWSGDPTGKIPFEIFYIDDKNDGGCKSDKFERDVRLLTEEITADPNNGRAHFYLAQSLKDLGKFQEAIKLFKRRIELGGWFEEVWYAHYQIGNCYNHLKMPDKMELWMNKAFKFHPKRAEPIYHLTRYFREHSEHFKSYHYYLKGKDIPYPKDDLLFIEEHVYKGLFDYENTILACYVYRKTQQDGLHDVIQYINKGYGHFLHNVWDNLHYYVEALTSSVYKGEYTKFTFKDHDEYKVSSCCLIPHSNEINKKFLMNARFVNYWIDEKGCYHMRSADGNVKTKNGYVYLNASHHPVDDVVVFDEDMDRYPSNIEGLEDVRIFSYNGALRFTASSKNITPTGDIVIACGDYRPSDHKMCNVKVLSPPRPSGCEKNWIFVPDRYLPKVDVAKDKMNFIYGWNPLEIGAINAENKLEIHTKYDTPAIFNRFRGSSPLVEYEDNLWGVVHFVKYSTPRVYYHSIVKFNRTTMKPEAYALPFCFRQTKIEYCLGFDLRDGVATFVFSENDSNPGMIHVPFTNLRFLQL